MIGTALPCDSSARRSGRKKPVLSLANIVTSAGYSTRSPTFAACLPRNTHRQPSSSEYSTFDFLQRVSRYTIAHYNMTCISPPLPSLAVTMPLHKLRNYPKTFFPSNYIKSDNKLMKLVSGGRVMTCSAHAAIRRHFKQHSSSLSD